MTAIGFVLFVVGFVFALLSNNPKSATLTRGQVFWMLVALVGLAFLVAACASWLWQVAP